MIPQIGTIEDTEQTTLPSKTYKLIIREDGPDNINGYVDNLEAIKQAIFHILSIERYAYVIYSNNYGVELEQYIGKPFNYLEANIEHTLRDALTYDLRILDITVNDITQTAIDIAEVKFTARTIYGNLQTEVNISV